ncbi:hypothetical protein HHI36_018186, partial [Cryptolaemus montrouzieri]
MNISIASTKFEYKREHKITWMIPGTTLGNQTNHILKSKKLEKVVHYDRSFRAANVDHFLMIAKIKRKIIRTNEPRAKKQKWNVENLCEGELKQELKLKINDLTSSNQSGDIEEERLISKAASSQQLKKSRANEKRLKTN